MNGIDRLKVSTAGILITGLFFGMAACQHRTFSYNGKMVKPENRIPLKEGGPHKSEWKTENLLLNYEYKRQGQSFEIYGVVSFLGHIAYNYRDFSNFFLTVYFTDAGGMINGEHTLASASIGQPIEKLEINSRITLPTETDNMVFGYRGHVFDRSSGNNFGVDGGIDWEFWTTPTR